MTKSRCCGRLEGGSHGQTTKQGSGDQAGRGVFLPEVTWGEAGGGEELGQALGRRAFPAEGGRGARTGQARVLAGLPGAREGRFLGLLPSGRVAARSCWYLRPVLEMIIAYHCVIISSSHKTASNREVARIEPRSNMWPGSFSFVSQGSEAPCKSWSTSVIGDCSRISDQAPSACSWLGFKTADFVFGVRDHVHQLIATAGVGVCEIP